MLSRRPTQVSRIGRRSEIVRLSHSSPVRLLPMATSAAEQLVPSEVNTSDERSEFLLGYIHIH